MRTRSLTFMGFFMLVELASATGIQDSGVPVTIHLKDSIVVKGGLVPNDDYSAQIDPSAPPARFVPNPRSFRGATEAPSLDTPNTMLAIIQSQPCLQHLVSAVSALSKPRIPANYLNICQSGKGRFKLELSARKPDIQSKLAVNMPSEDFNLFGFSKNTARYPFAFYDIKVIFECEVSASFYRDRFETEIPTDGLDYNTVVCTKEKPENTANHVKERVEKFGYAPLVEANELTPLGLYRPAKGAIAPLTGEKSVPVQPSKISTVKTPKIPNPTPSHSNLGGVSKKAGSLGSSNE